MYILKDWALLKTRTLIASRMSLLHRGDDFIVPNLKSVCKLVFLGAQNVKGTTSLRQDRMFCFVHVLFVLRVEWKLIGTDRKSVV